MFNDIISGISIKLYEVFGEGYKIYTEDVKQGLKVPCFIIRHINTSITPYLGSRKKLSNAFKITYIPSETKKYKDIDEVLVLLVANMEFINTAKNELFYGNNIRSETADGLLHFFINYNCTTRNAPENKDYMEKLNIKEAVEDGNY